VFDKIHFHIPRCWLTPVRECPYRDLLLKDVT
jgi:hypothetical protein